MSTITFTIQSTDEDVEDFEISEQAQYLRKDLLELDVEDVMPKRLGPAPEGAKPLEMLDWSTLVVTMAASTAGVSAVLGMVSNWLGRNKENEISMSLPNGASLTLRGDFANGKEFEQILTMVNRAYHAEPSAELPSTGTDSLVSLREKMISFLTLDDIEVICFDLGINYDVLSGDNLEIKVISLLKKSNPGRIDEVKARCRIQNGAIDWD